VIYFFIEGSKCGEGSE